jgi:spore germination protein GerM
VNGSRIVLMAVALAAAAVAGLLFVAAPRWSGRPAAGSASAAPAATAPAPPGKKIKARLFYVSDDGTRLVGVEREVAYGEGAVEQAREIVQAQIAPVSEPLVSAIPHGTALRALFVTERGEAYVDLSREVAAAHSGGTLDELLTIYALVDALTANLPAVKAVQVLVDGKAVDTLAGHIDLRHPITKNLDWVQ